MITLMDRKELEQLKESKPKRAKRNWYTTDERWEMLKAAAEKHGVSTNRIMDRAVDRYLEALTKLGK